MFIKRICKRLGDIANKAGEFEKALAGKHRAVLRVKRGECGEQSESGAKEDLSHGWVVCPNIGMAGSNVLRS